MPQNATDREGLPLHFSNEPNRVEGRRPWWLRLFGGKPLILAISADEMRRTVGLDVEQISIASIDHIAVTTHWYGTRLRMTSRGSSNAVAWPLLAHDDAETIAARLRAALHGPGCGIASAEFYLLLAAPGYLNRKRVRGWVDRHVGLWLRVRHFPPMSDRLPVTDTIAAAVDRFRNYYSNWERLVAERNDNYVRTTANEYADFFAHLEKQPLSDRQIEAVLRDEDNSLVVAGAGTGKTSTVVGKVGFLIKSGAAKPEEVLALAFARKAKEEMQQRILNYTGREVEVRTFHSLGLQIVTAVEGERSAIASMAVHERELMAWVSTCLSDLLKDPALRHLVVNFAVNHRQIAKYLDEFRTREEYLRYLRKHEAQTLRGEFVRSFEELLIADWLTINGIRYQYEAPYERKTTSQGKRQYKPDFYLVDSGVYLEHFGVNRDGTTAPDIDAAKYADGIRWKRELHRMHGTRLVETYSYERQEGTLLRELERKLVSAGVAIAPLSDDELRNLVEHFGIKKPLVALVKDFLNVFKANVWTLDEVRALSRVSDFPIRANAFLDLFEVVYERYEEHLERRSELDFSDLIARATVYVETGAYKSQFTRIIVDEFQDISRGRKKLLQALLQQVEDCRLFCVGDDWQSIFAFTGNDVTIMTSFEGVFGHTVRTDLDRTFRFNEELLRLSSKFIQKNPAQLKKTLTSQNRIDAPAVHLVVDGAGALSTAVTRADRIRSEGRRASVLLLGRYNFLEPDGWQELANLYPMLDIRYHTVHKAKGLEADFVVLLGIRAGKYGFPSEVASDPMMSLVVPSENDFEYAEERRLFYVALTRARHSVFILADRTRPSVFVEELLTGEYGPDLSAGLYH